MNRNPRSSFEKRQWHEAQRQPADAQWLAIQALTFFGEHPDQAQRFFSWSGLDAETLRPAARDPGFAAGLVDFFAQNLGSLEAFSAYARLEPAELIKLTETQKERGLSSHDDL